MEVERGLSLARSFARRPSLRFGEAFERVFESVVVPAVAARTDAGGEVHLAAWYESAGFKNARRAVLGEEAFESEVAESESAVWPDDHTERAVRVEAGENGVDIPLIDGDPVRLVVGVDLPVKGAFHAPLQSQRASQVVGPPRPDGGEPETCCNGVYSAEGFADRLDRLAQVRDTLFRRKVLQAGAEELNSVVEDRVCVHF